MKTLLVEVFLFSMIIMSAIVDLLLRLFNCLFCLKFALTGGSKRYSLGLNYFFENGGPIFFVSYFVILTPGD